MNDNEAMELLRLLEKYVKAYTPDIPQTISALAEDLAVGLNDDNFADAVLLWNRINTTEGVT